LRFDHHSDLSVLQNHGLALLCLSQHNIHHHPGQIVGSNHLVREQHSKHRVDRAHEAVAEIRFLPLLYRVDVRGPENVEMGEPAASRDFSASPL
jgi:hypothetical protein